MLWCFYFILFFQLASARAGMGVLCGIITDLRAFGGLGTQRTPCLQRWCLDSKAMKNSPSAFDHLPVYAHCRVSPRGFILLFQTSEDLQTVTEMELTEKYFLFPTTRVPFPHGAFWVQGPGQAKMKFGWGPDELKSVTAWTFAASERVARHPHIHPKGLEVLGLILKSLLCPGHCNFAINSSNPKFSSS